MCLITHVSLFLSGKFWHRHRRPRPVEYNTDPDFHSGLKRDADQAKTTAAAKKRGGAAALRAQNNNNNNNNAGTSATPAETSEAQTPVARSNGGDVDISSRQSPVPAPDDRAISPVSTASSASEPPLAQRLKVNGLGSHTRNATPLPTSSAPASTAAATATASSVASAGGPPHSSTKADVSPAKPASNTVKANPNTGAAPTSPTRPWVCGCFYFFSSAS